MWGIEWRAGPTWHWKKNRFVKKKRKKKKNKKKHYTLNLGDRWIYVIGNCRVMSMGKSLLNLNGILLQFICTVRCYKKITGVRVLGLSLWQIRSFWNPCLPTQWDNTLTKGLYLNVIKIDPHESVYFRVLAIFQTGPKPLFCNGNWPWRNYRNHGLLPSDPAHCFLIPRDFRVCSRQEQACCTLAPGQTQSHFLAQMWYVNYHYLHNIW